MVPWGVFTYRSTGRVASLLVGVGGGAVAVALALYLRYVIRRYARSKLASK